MVKKLQIFRRFFLTLLVAWSLGTAFVTMPVTDATASPCPNRQCR